MDLLLAVRSLAKEVKIGKKMSFMKKLYEAIAIAVVMFVVGSCTKDEIINRSSLDDKLVKLSAIISSDGTKTSLGPKNDGVYPVLWTEGDAITVFTSGKASFVLNGKGGKSVGDFYTSQNESYSQGGAMYAYYPDGSVISSTVSNNKINVTIPSEQQYLEGSFGVGSSPMAAYKVADGVNSLVFNNLFGALKLQLVGKEVIDNIEVVSDKVISGPATVTFNTSTGTSSIKLTSSTQQYKSVKLNCGDGVLLTSVPKDFLIALPPTITDQGHNLTIIITEKVTGNRRVLRTNSPKIINASEIVKLPEIVFTPQNGEYIVDELGKKTYFGKGIAINGVIWAPVNCGYEPATKETRGYVFGKLYQWGRKYGQGYYNDATYPSGNNLVQDGWKINISEVQKADNKDKFYLAGSSMGMWCSSTSKLLWNSGSESSPNKVLENDPCPEGWRVPSKYEFAKLSSVNSSWGMSSGQYGILFNDKEKLFMPASGVIDSFSGVCSNREQLGYYWTSTAEGGYSVCNWWSNTGTAQESLYRGMGMSVRCVKDS